VEEDTRHAGRIDRITTYLRGVPVKTVCDANGGRFMEIITLFTNGNPHLQTQRENRDGRSDIRTILTQEKRGKGSKAIPIWTGTSTLGSIVEMNGFQGQKETRQETGESA